MEVGPEWQFEFEASTSATPIDWPLLAEQWDQPRYMTITVRHWGVPVFVADGPLKVTFASGGPEALAEMMRAANRVAESP